jgi:hypothetical protein
MAETDVQGNVRSAIAARPISWGRVQRRGTCEVPAGGGEATFRKGKQWPPVFVNSCRYLAESLTTIFTEPPVATFLRSLLPCSREGFVDIPIGKSCALLEPCACPEHGIPCGLLAAGWRLREATVQAAACRHAARGQKRGKSRSPCSWRAYSHAPFGGGGVWQADALPANSTPRAVAPDRNRMFASFMVCSGSPPCACCTARDRGRTGVLSVLSASGYAVRNACQIIRRKRSELPTTLRELHIIAAVAAAGGSIVSIATGIITRL